MRSILGGVLLFGGVIAMLAVWLFTTYVFFATDQMFLAMVSLLIPPADIVLPFLISPTLGFIGLGSLVMAFTGSALMPD